MKIKKGDTIEIIAGKDHGKRGEILRVIPKTSRVVVQGLNLRKKHQRAKPGATPSGRQMAPEILQFEGSMDASNVMLVCPKCDNKTRVGYQQTEAGHVRVCKHQECQAIID